MILVQDSSQRSQRPQKMIWLRTNYPPSSLCRSVRLRRCHQQLVAKSKKTAHLGAHTAQIFEESTANGSHYATHNPFTLCRARCRGRRINRTSSPSKLGPLGVCRTSVPLFAVVAMIRMHSNHSNDELAGACGRQHRHCHHKGRATFGLPLAMSRHEWPRTPRARYYRRKDIKVLPRTQAETLCAASDILSEIYINLCCWSRSNWSPSNKSFR